MNIHTQALSTDQREISAPTPLREALTILHERYSPTEILDCMTRIYEERGAEQLDTQGEATYEILGILIGTVVRTINRI